MYLRLRHAAAILATGTLVVTGFAGTADAADGRAGSDRIQGRFVVLPNSAPSPAPAGAGDLRLQGFSGGPEGVSPLGEGEGTHPWATPMRESDPVWSSQPAADFISAPAPGGSGIVRFESGQYAGEDRCLGADFVSIVSCATAPSFTWRAADEGSAKSELAVLVNPDGTTFDYDPATGTITAAPLSSTSDGFNTSTFVPLTGEVPAGTISATFVDQRMAATVTGVMNAGDRPITAYLWDFGDGTSADGTAQETHDYGAPGTYTVSVTMVDSMGIRGTVTTEIVVPEPGAYATVTAVQTMGRVASFDTTGSFLPGGEAITSFAWEYGDGSTEHGTSPQGSHVYAAPGTYTVSVVVSGASGAAATATTTITVAGQAPYVYDTFGRGGSDIAGAWGEADLGGLWIKKPVGLSTAGGQGVMAFTQPRQTVQTYLPTVSARDVAVAFDVSLDALPAGATNMIGSVVRETPNGDYRVKLVIGPDGTTGLRLIKYIGNVEVVVKAQTVAWTYVPGQVLHVEFEAVGSKPTALRAKVWQDGQPEPAAWMLTHTDSQAEIQGKGSVGFAGYVSSEGDPGQFIRIDNYRVTQP